MITVYHDMQSDMLTLSFSDQAHGYTVEASPGVYVNFDENDALYEIEVHGISNITEDPEKIEFKKLGQVVTATLTVDQFAELHDMNPNSVRHILQNDAKLSESEKRLPGAYKEGGDRRGVWKIPLATAEHWSKSNL